MKEPPIHPATGQPVTPEQLIDESDALDRQLASGDFAGLVLQVQGLRRLNARLEHFFKWLAIAFVLVVVLAVFSSYVALRVDRNTHEINQTQQALQVYCQQTNINNADARVKFIAKFGAQTPPEQQQQLADFVEVLFPQRDCTNVTEPTTSVPEPTTSVPPDGVPPSTATPPPP